ncbi:DUF6932 family protein [Streptomyces sp. NRRL S-244]|uniref:DUF6932 family protein n=1 Tax=Streptomyces sp. NRRL S-244 TaxID=1463897 RepID=UPI0004BF0E94|nr:hypothetical protein [Streptomyces sp. NRRL S-244]
MELTFEDNGHLQPGRYQVDLDRAREFLVEHHRFSESLTRAPLWEGLERYLIRFWALEDQHSTRLAGSTLIDRLWLGGSYVSHRVNPDNIDLTVIIDHEAEQRVRNQLGARWLTDAFQRESIKTEFGLSPIPMRYVRVASPFKKRELDQKDRQYYSDRGAWDDWWQRRRASDHIKDGPTVETAVASRGYLEVTL